MWLVLAAVSISFPPSSLLEVCHKAFDRVGQQSFPCLFPTGEMALCVAPTASHCLLVGDHQPYGLYHHQAACAETCGWKFSTSEGTTMPNETNVRIEPAKRMSLPVARQARLTRRGMLKSAVVAAPAFVGCGTARVTAAVPVVEQERESGTPSGLIGPERQARFAYVDWLIRTGSSEGEPTQLIYKSAGEQSRMLRAKQISCRELTDAHLAHIERVNPTINALTERVSPDELRKQADAVDNAIARREVNWQEKPLMGLLEWGKNLQTKGVRTTHATLGLQDVEPSKDDTMAPMLLREAGALIAGLTNTPEFAYGYESDNLVYGRTNNPRALDFMAGGSSGGVGAALVAGFGPLGLGSDGGGSSRHPAANSGCVGFKQTWGRTPGTGELEGYSPWRHLVVHGPLTRYVRDAAMMEAILAEADGLDPFIPPLPYPDYTRVKVAGLRIAVMPYNGIAQAEPAILSALDRVAGSLDKAGAAVTEARPAGIDAAYEIYNTVVSRFHRVSWEQRLNEVGTGSRISPMFARILRFHNDYEESHRCSDPASIMEIDKKWGAFTKSMAQFFMDYDALLCPVQTETAMKHGTSPDNMPAFTYMQAANLAGVPAISVPAEYLANGLTADVQVMSRRWRDDIVLAVGEYLERESGGWRPSSLPLFQDH
jgi:amidase